MDLVAGDPPRRRRFTLGDGLVLMAVLALAIMHLRANAWFNRIPIRARVQASSLPRMLTWPPPSLIRGSIACQIIGQILEELLTFLSWFLLALTLGTPYIRLLRPRLPLRELLWQPGFVASSSIILSSWRPEAS